MENHQNLGISTLCVHAGSSKDELGSVVTPIYQTSTFKFKNAEQGAKLFKGEEKGFIYTRLGNPTVEAMEDAVAELEGGYKAIGCASGMAAVHTMIAGMVKSGDHIVCSESVYGATSVLLSSIMPEFGIETTFVDSSNIEQVKNAIKPNTRMIYIETPGNPTLAITDLAAVGKIAKEKGIYFAVDNTFMSPILQKPFEFGADFIVHSMTKYLNGHADVVAGIIVVKTPEHYAILRKMSNHFGGVIDPFNSFLVHRGLMTLSLRVLRQQENAQKVAEFLENHPKIENIQFPGLPSHPQYELAQKQQKGSGSMISIDLKGGYEAGVKLMNNVKLFQLAVSLGGVESLIQHPASMTHAGMDKESRLKAKITDGLVRLSIGIEDPEDLIEDLKQALNYL